MPTPPKTYGPLPAEQWLRMGRCPRCTTALQTQAINAHQHRARCSSCGACWLRTTPAQQLVLPLHLAGAAC